MFAWNTLHHELRNHMLRFKTEDPGKRHRFEGWLSVFNPVVVAEPTSVEFGAGAAFDNDSAALRKRCLVVYHHQGTAAGSKVLLNLIIQPRREHDPIPLCCPAAKRLHLMPGGTQRFTQFRGNTGMYFELSFAATRHGKAEYFIGVLGDARTSCRPKLNAQPLNSCFFYDGCAEPDVTNLRQLTGRYCTG